MSMRAYGETCLRTLLLLTIVSGAYGCGGKSNPTDAGPDGGDAGYDAGADAGPDSGPPCVIDQDCDDSIGCTTDYCDGPSATCFHLPDDFFCTDDGLSCTTQSCDPVLDCQATPIGDGTTCDDGTPGRCIGTACVPNACTQDAHCDDSNACTTDTCDLGTNLCSSIPVTCDDGDAC